MFKNLTKVFAFVLVLAVMVTSMASCEWPWGDKTPDVCKDHVDADGDRVCDKEGCGMALEYTYNTYLSTFPKMWNPHDYETATESEILGYTTLGFYTFDYNETKDGFQIVPEMAAEMPLDVTANYVDEKWGIAEGDTSRAWLIELRDDLAWEDGTPITANDFVESAKRLLNPKALNHRADSLYSGDLEIVNARNYFYSGSTVRLPAHEVYEGYAEDILDKLIFTLGPGSAECYVRTWQGFPASYDVARTAQFLIDNYGSYMADKDGKVDFTAEKAVAMEGKTLAEIEADPELLPAWISAARFGMALAGDPIVWCTADGTFPITEWENVGIKAISDTEIVLILASELDGFYLNYSLGTDLGLVHIPTYDACESIDPETGIYTNTYGTSVETFKSFGPYKLTKFVMDQQIVLERNDEWYGYSDPARAGQYQTTRVVYDRYENSDTAFEAFLQGKLDSKGLEAKNINDYVGADRLYYTNGASTWFIALNPNEEAFAAWEKDHPGYDKSILTMKEFRMALSFSLNRQDFIKALDPMGSIGLALYNDMICSDPENGVMYRNEDAAKDTILDFWGISQDDIGEGKMFADKDEAIASITGYNLDGAKELFNQAYDAAVEAGIYNGTDTIQICVGIPSQADFYTQGFEFLKNNYTEAVKGTKLEGKLDFIQDTTVGDNFSDSLKSNQTDMLFGVGWSGSALNPFGLIEAYTTKDYQYDAAWDTSKALMDFEIDGVVYTASVLDWTKAINGETIKIAPAGEVTEEGAAKDYSCGTADADADPAKKAERIRLLAAIEGAVLRNYDMIPTHNQASASLLGYQVNYGTEEYVYGVGRGGIQYMTYNYTDAEWDAFVKSQNGVLKYN